MNLRLRIPFNTYLFSGSASALEVQTTFQHDSYEVRISFEGSQATTSQDSTEAPNYFRVLFHMLVEVRGGPPDLTVDALVRDENWGQLIKVLTPMLNRVFRAIRNYGFASHVDEIRPKEGDADRLLRKWDAQSSEDGEHWAPLHQGFSSLFLPLFGSDESEPGMLRAERWPVIEEAIQDDLEPGPERELLTNSLEHLAERNYRLAMLEAVICLEIVLNGFLRLHLSVRRKLSESRMKKVLDSQLGLTTRVGLVLELVLNKKERDEANIEDVLQAIGWRNHIVHKTGRLPAGVPENNLKDAIWATLDPAQTLGGRRDELASTPEVSALTNALVEAYGVTVTEAGFLRNHRVTMSIHTGTRDQAPSDDRLLSIVGDVISRCKSRDPRFVPEDHLSIKFSKGLMRTYAIWAGGKLERLPEPQHTLGLPPVPARFPD